MHVFTRTGELRLATWDEIDLEGAQWEIPAERMKMGNPHVVPLSNHVVHLLRQQKEETTHLKTPWVFPNQPRPQTPMSNNTILFGIGRLGYKGDMTGHGFRAIARTAIRERLGYDADVIEAQLAHSKGDNVRRAYDRTTFLPQRQAMMQDWSDYLKRIAATGEVPKTFAVRKGVNP
jgi:integrase